MASDMPSIRRQLPPQPVVICDPVHLLKRIRYRWATERFSVADASRGFSFSFTGIRQAGYLSPVAFANIQERTVHDSLPLELFSVKTLAFVLATDLPREVMVVPWCLLVAALTLPNVSTQIRLDCLEVGFWFLYLCQDARCSPTRPSSSATAQVTVRPAGRKQIVCTRAHRFAMRTMRSSPLSSLSHV
jgi:hypothetical protein